VCHASDSANIVPIQLHAGKPHSHLAGETTLALVVGQEPAGRMPPAVRELHRFSFLSSLGAVARPAAVQTLPKSF
jgi:hypothetical protein